MKLFLEEFWFLKRNHLCRCRSEILIELINSIFFVIKFDLLLLIENKRFILFRSQSWNIICNFLWEQHWKFIRITCLSNKMEFWNIDRYLGILYFFIISMYFIRAQCIFAFVVSKIWMSHWIQLLKLIAFIVRFNIL